MTDKGLVSIIVPVFNQEQYLNNSITSLRRQTYSNIEILLVNDGSTDTSGTILHKFACLDNRIRVIEKKNGGLVDATLTGIENSTGNYICFLDPDDFIGETFIEFFMNSLDLSYDVIAAGYLTDRNGHYSPHFLKKDEIYEKEKLSELTENYLLNDQGTDVSNRIFISRWNKMYSRECIEKVVEDFKLCRGISLGEDSIFTYLALKNSSKIKAVSTINSYYYNIGNQNSMMKTGDVSISLEKCKKTFEVFKKLILSYKDENNIKQAYVLYYFLVNSVFQRVRNTNEEELKELFSILKKDDIYKEALNIILSNCNSSKEKVGIIIKKNIYNVKVYKIINEGMQICKGIVKKVFREFPKFFSDTKKCGLNKAIYLRKFRNDRKNAVKNLYDNLPIIEDRILPIINKYKDKKTDLEKCPIEKNVFIFWWDGFDNAPNIVNACLESVKTYYNDCNIVKITKNTYEKYTTINEKIVNDFKKGVISVQTFSDILRFNLLMNNGGVWIDATIFFLAPFNLLDNLKEKSFESLEFSSSHDFLKYKEKKCSWSGYFIASRKNALLVTVINEVFEKYYLKYHTYSIYFFIDAVFMICKLHKVDDAALDKIQYVNSDMFLLAKLLNYPDDARCYDLIKYVPQKLMWNFQPNNSKNSFYRNVVLNHGEKNESI
ncbi:MAG: capsular polysaccharide synthesis protein [Agathobacter rectalis]